MDYDEIFWEAGLARGRHFGSKSGYRQNNPVCIFIPNAFVCDERAKIWGGDLDLMTADTSRLISVAQRLGFALYVLREQFYELTPETIQMHAEAIVERGEVRLSPALQRNLTPEIKNRIRITRYVSG